MIVPTDAAAGVRAEDLGRVHFVGIGGVGMSCLARIYLARHIEVSGSDVKENREVVALRALGATVHLGNAAGNLGNADTVVVSAAIRPSNPEVVEAIRRELAVIPRAAALAAAMIGRRSVAVAGTHGKTTTTSMLTVALQRCGADPSFAIGGNLNDSGANAHDGSGDVFVAEADESDGSFLLYTPSIAVITNVEPDHLDHYGTPEAVEEAFMAFAGCIAAGGTLVACIDDPGAQRVAAHATGSGTKGVTYGRHDAADVRVADVRLDGAATHFTLVAEGERHPVRLEVPGVHNALNAAAAFAAARELGFPAAALVDGLTSFTGTRRRFEFKGSAGGVRVFDSYDHHPTEVRAVLAAARQVAGTGRVIAAFQPHRYSRTAAFRGEFGAALGLADEVVVMEVYGAGERPVPGATGASVAAAIPLPADCVVFEPSWSAVAGHLAARAKPGDVVLTLGAGDVTMIGPEVLAVLRGSR